MSPPRAPWCRFVAATALAAGAAFLSAAPSAAVAEVPVLVIVDMDATTPGFQSNIDVPLGESGVVRDIGVYVLDPLGQRAIWGIGYLGGIDRGIAFGHVPNNQQHLGMVAGLLGVLRAPVNPGNFPVMVTSPGLDRAFAGPEVQYVEGGAVAAATLPAEAGEPVFTVDVLLQGAAPGDTYDFYLLDFVVIWSEGVGGAFSTVGPLSLDTGGDSVPDGTASIYGIDADVPIPVPPAAFLVDFVDGNPGPATITVVSTTGLSVAVDPSPVHAYRLYQNTPNPFNPATTIHYELPARVPMRLSVYDASGRLVRELVRSVAHPAGRYGRRWDGRDDHGRVVPSGVYLYRLEAGETGAYTATRRLILVR